MAFPKGSKVRQKAPAIEGSVSGTRFDEDAQELVYHVDYTGADGQKHARWFKESELQLLSAPEAQAEQAKPAAKK